ncbi:MAG: arginine deiminase family protein [Candidatus Omnitrophota bacterium]
MPCCFVDSEYKPLKAVLLCKPHPKIGNVANPKEVHHLSKINYAVIEKEYEQIIRIYRKFKIKIFLINLPKIEGTDNRYRFNIIFTRDHFLMTPHGAIISRMFSDIRQSEIKYAQKALKIAGVPIRMVIRDNGTFEGADALWINDRLVIVGVGNRTNAEGFRQIKEELKQDGINCIRVPVPRDTLHLLGVLQLIDSDTALVRTDLIGSRVIGILKENRIKMITIPESTEVREKQAMNFVIIANKAIIMATGCPQTKKIYEQAGIKIAAEISISQFISAGGGLACVTGILARSWE